MFWGMYFLCFKFKLQTVFQIYKEQRWNVTVLLLATCMNKFKAHVILLDNVDTEILLIHLIGINIA